MYWTHGYVCTVSRHQSNYKENHIFISIANCLVNLLNISLSNHFVLHFSSLKKVKQALFNVTTACCSSNMRNKNHSSLLSYKKNSHFCTGSSWFFFLQYLKQYIYQGARSGEFSSLEICVGLYGHCFSYTHKNCRRLLNIVSSFLSSCGRNKERILLSRPNRTIITANTVYKAPNSNMDIKLNVLGTGSFKKPRKALFDLCLGMPVNLTYLPS